MDRAQEIGLFRWKIVGEATDISLSARERGRLVRALAEREHLDPDGCWVRIGRNTLDRWIRAYRKGGFDALVPGAATAHEGHAGALGVGGRASAASSPLARQRRSTGSAWSRRVRRRRLERSSGTFRRPVCRGRAARSRERSGGSRLSIATSCGPGTRCTAR